MLDKDILLCIKRKYSKDEEISIILQELKQKDIEIGMLRAELSESKDIIAAKECDIINYKRKSLFINDVIAIVVADDTLRQKFKNRLNAILKNND